MFDNINWSATLTKCWPLAIVLVIGLCLIAYGVVDTINKNIKK